MKSALNALRDPSKVPRAQNAKSPLPGGQARRNKLLVSWGPLVIAAPLAGSFAPLRCAAPCQSQARATSPPSRYPHLSQAAFAPFRSVALSIFGRPSFTPCATARSALIRPLAPAQLGQMQDRRKSSKCDALHALGPCSQGSHCAPMRIARRSRNNKNATHVAINGATSESGKRHEPVAQVRRSGDCLRLHHSNHRIDVCGFEPELLFAVDLSLRKLRQVFGKALFERLP